MRHLSLLVLALAGLGCPGRQYLDVDVVSPERRPLAGAVATAVCDEHDSAAARSDRDGRARLRFVERERRQPCTLTVARPGYDTARLEVDRLCQHSGCRPIEVELAGGQR